MNNDDEKNHGARRPEDWAPEEKLRAVVEASGLSDAELGAWLRGNGIKEEHLRQWRESALSGFSARPSRAGADGTTERVRKRSPIQSKAGAEEFERKLRTALLEPARVSHREVPKFSEYASEFMRTYAVANNKPSEQSSKASMLKHHLLPAFGKMRLDEIKKAARERQALVLTGGDAGLRQGEMIALDWGDVDLVAGMLTVRRSAWRGIVGAPKGGRERKVPLTARLALVLKAHRRLRSDRVFCRSDGSPLAQSAIEAALRFSCKRAGLRVIGSHALRHSFCSHLAMRGAPPKAIQELAGHSTLSMTLRYMHLAPSVLRDAISLLNPSVPAQAGHSVGNA